MWVQILWLTDAAKSAHPIRYITLEKPFRSHDIVLKGILSTIVLVENANIFQCLWAAFGKPPKL